MALASVYILKRHICKHCKLLPYKLRLTTFVFQYSSSLIASLLTNTGAFQLALALMQLNNSLVLNLTLFPKTLCKEIILLLVLNWYKTELIFICNHLILSSVINNLLFCIPNKCPNQTTFSDGSQLHFISANKNPNLPNVCLV